MYVINPLPKEKLQSFFDDQAMDVMKYFFIKSLFAQPEVLPGQKALPVQVPKEHIEQWFTQALNVEPVGAGSYPIDIYNKEGRWGSDIKMLAVKLDKHGAVKNADSGEASLGQKFTDVGIDLDSLFSDKKYEEIKTLWLALYKDKFAQVRQTYDIDKFYYFFILRSGPTFYMTGASVELNNIDAVTVKRATKSSVYLDGLIEDSLGNGKIYKAKKRLELRLRPKDWIEKGYAMQFKTNFVSVEKDLRASIIEPKFIEDMLKRFETLTIEIV